MSHIKGKARKGTLALFSLVAVAALVIAVLTSTISVSAQSQDRDWRQSPTGLTVSAGDEAGELDITWDAHSQATKTLSDYRVAWTPDGADFKAPGETDWNAFPTTNRLTVTGLTAGETYKVKVRARYDDNKKSRWSVVVTGQSGAAPPNSAATGQPVITGTAQVRETLSAGTSGISDDNGLTNAAFTYQWVHSADGTDTGISGATGTTYLPTSADAGSAIKVRVSFTDDDGYSETVTSNATASVVAQSEPADPPAAPVGLTGTSDGDSVSLSWNDPEDASITGHQVLRRNPQTQDAGVFDTVAADTGSADTSYVDTTVATDTRYFYRVLAINAAGTSPRSGYLSVFTEATVDLGDITSQDGVVFTEGSVGSGGDGEDRFKFALTTPKKVGLGLRRQEANADLYLEDEDGQVLSSGENEGTENEWITKVLLSGTYYVRVEARQAGENDYKFRYGVSEADAAEVQRLQEEQTDDYPDQAEGAPSVAVGSTVTGKHETEQDQDWFAVELNQEQTYQLDLTGSAKPIFHEVQDATGAALSERKDSTEWDNTATEGNSADGEGSPESEVVTRTGYDSWSDQPVSAAGITVSDVALQWAWPPTENGPDDSQSAATLRTAENNGDESRSDGGAEDTVVFGPGWLQITPKDTGTYYVGIKSDKGTGDFTMSLRQMMDDFAGNTSTSGTVAVGSTINGDIGSDGDQDWFAVSLTADYIYRIDLMGAQSSDGTLRDPYLHGIHNFEGKPIGGTSDGDGGAGTNSRVVFIPDSTGTYYVAAGGERHQTGTYTLAVTQLPDDFSQDTSTTGTVTVDGAEVTGEIEHAGDRDWFKVELTTGKTYRFNLMGSWTGHGTLLDPLLGGIHDSAGNYINGTKDNDGGADWNSRLDYQIATTGTYYVAAAGYTAGTYTLAVLDITDGAPDDYPADTSTTGAVTVGGSTGGEIEFVNDHDWFKVTLEAGKTYRFDQMALGVHRGTLMDPVLKGIYDSSGNPIPGIADNREGLRWTGRIIFTPAAAGDYYAAAGNMTGIDREGTYVLSVTDMSPGQTDDYSEDSSTTAAVTVGSPAKGRIETTGDRDWFSVTLSASKVYRFDMKGAWSGDGTLLNPYINGIRNSSGTLSNNTSDDDDGIEQNALVFYTSSTGGTYHVDVSGADVGTYTVVVTNITDDSPDDHSSDTDTTSTVSVDGSATGDIGHPGDRDWFAVELTKNQSYQFDLKGAPTGDGLPGHGTMADPHLYGIHNSEGTLISGTSNDDGGVDNYSRVRFTPNQTGKHFVAAGGNSGTYTLYVSAVVNDDYSASTGTSGTVAVGGSVIGEIETEGDRDWFAVSLNGGTTYRFDLKGARTGDGALFDPDISGIHHSSGAYVDGTADDDGGVGLNSRVLFTPGTSGTYYVSAGAYRDWLGSYTLYVKEE